MMCDWIIDEMVQYFLYVFLIWIYLDWCPSMWIKFYISGKKTVSSAHIFGSMLIDAPQCWSIYINSKNGELASPWMFWTTNIQDFFNIHLEKKSWMYLHPSPDTSNNSTNSTSLLPHPMSHTSVSSMDYIILDKGQLPDSR